MKRILIPAIIFLFIGIGKAFAVPDEYGSGRPAMWRSTTTSQSLNFVLLSTGQIHIHSIHVGSATINGIVDTFVAIFNSTAVPTASNAPNFLSTAAFQATNANQNAPNIPQAFPDVYCSSGAVINKAGNATVTIYWDYVETRLKEKMKAFVPYRP